MKSLIKDFVYTIRRLILGPRKAGIILVYHSVSDENKLNFTVTPKQFEDQMAYLAKNDFKVVSLDQLMKYREAGFIPEKTVAITFDDGYQDNYTQAFPILKKYNFPATIFLTTSDLGQIRVVREVSFKILSPEELKTLESSGIISIEAHTVSHPKLTQVSKAEIEKEISESKKIIDKILNKNCIHCAYPKGRYNSAVLEIIPKTGIHYGYTTIDGFVTTKSPAYEIPRNGISGSTSMAQFKGIVVGGRITRTNFL